MVELPKYNHVLSLEDQIKETIGKDYLEWIKSLPFPPAPIFVVVLD